MNAASTEATDGQGQGGTQEARGGGDITGGKGGGGGITGGKGGGGARCLQDVLTLSGVVHYC